MHVAETRVIPLGTECTNHEHFSATVFLARDPFCFCKKLGPVALVLKGARQPVSNWNCLPEYVEFPDDCSVLVGDFGSVSFLCWYPDSDVSNQDVMFRVLDGQKNVSSPGPFVVQSLELDPLQVWTLTILEVGNPDLSASDAMTPHIPIRELVLHELAEIPVLHTVHNPIDRYLSLDSHDSDPSWNVLFDLCDEMG